MATPKKSTTKKTGTKKPAAKKTLAKKVADKKKTSKNVVSKKKGDQRADVKKATAGKASAKKSTSTSKKAAISKAKAAPSKATLKKATSKTAKVATGKVAKAAPAKKAAAPKKEKVVTKKNDGIFRCPISQMPVKAEKPNISEKTLQKLKELLEEEHDKHVAQMNDLLQDADDLIADREGGDTVFDEESGEGDSVAVERERSLYLAAETKHTIDQIDAALEKIKNKTYGVCGPSSRRISVDRLTAIPWTDVCVDCKSRSERRL